MLARYEDRPAPAVIPAPRAYIIAAAVKGFVVGARVRVAGCPLGDAKPSSAHTR